MKFSTLALIATLSLSSVSALAAAAGLPATVTCDVSVKGKAEGLDKSATIVINEGKNDQEERTLIVRKDGVLNEVEISIELSDDNLDISILAMDGEEDDITEAKASIPLRKGDASLSAYVSNKLSRLDSVLLDKVSVDCSVE